MVAEGRAARRRRARERRREKAATSQPIVRESHESDEHEPREGAPESRVARPEPVVDVELLPDVTPPRARSIDNSVVHGDSEFSRGHASSSPQPLSLISFSAGFGGGFVAGHFSRPSPESINVSRHEPVAEPQPTRAAVEEPKPVAATTQTVAPISSEKVSSSEPSAATKQMVAPTSKEAATESRQPAVPAVDSGRLLVRSTPAGAAVVLDGQKRGVTPLALRELAFGAHTIEVSHPNHETRQRRLTLSERRPARSVDFELRSTSVPAHATAAANSPGSLQVASRPSGAQVFVDDNLIGTTPLLLSNVAAGSKRLRIELSGYKVWTTSVQIEPSARFRVSASLEP